MSHMWLIYREWSAPSASAIMCAVISRRSPPPRHTRPAPWLVAWAFAWSAACENTPELPPAAAFPKDAGGMSANDAGADAGYVRPAGMPQLPGVDRAVVLPFLGPTQSVEVEIEAALRSLDVHFSIDTTASFGEEIEALQDDLSDEVVPELRKRVPDVSVGVSSFEDFPLSPFGSEEDKPFELRTAITSDLSRVDAALAGLDRPIGNGADGPESGAEALYQIATGEGYRLGMDWIIAPYSDRGLRGGGTLGGVGFREGALHAVVHITDAPSHTPRDYESVFPGTHSLQQAADALDRLAIRTLGVVSSPLARTDMEFVARATGATTPPDADGCPMGLDGDHLPSVNGACPLVFDVRDDGKGLSDTLTDAIVALVNAVDIRRAYAEVDNDPLSFVTAVEALDADVLPGVEAPELFDERPSDGIVDTFVGVRPGTRLRFAVHLRNTLLVGDDAPQFFTVTLNLVGDGLSLGTRTVRVEVPPAPRGNDGGL